jgi:two-component system, LytTR family, response regulator
MKCILVDNEPNALKKLSILIAQNFSDVQVVASCTKINEAVKAINTLAPDVVFLDVELNGETGFDLLDYFNTPNFEIVFTTAHEKYALKAIKAACFEFLLKPIVVSDLSAVIDKLRVAKQPSLHEKIDLLKKNIHAGKNFNQIAIPTLDEYLFINTSDIVCMRADVKYTSIYTIDGATHITSKNIGEYEDILSEEHFFRCHKSSIVNLKHAKRFSKQTNILTLDNNMEIDVATRKREEFLKRFFKP